MPTQRHGAFEELTSTEKAARYRETYTAAIINDSSKCLGSYAFYWGVKQEVTATWFSMFLHDGSRLAPIDTMTELWSGKPPANKCPVITQLTIAGTAKAKPGTTLTASLKSSDPESDPLKVEWALMRDPEEYGTGGDAEDAHLLYPAALVKTDNTSAEIVLPEDGGLYRLFATVHDGLGGAAVANVPLRVDAPMIIAKGADTELPLILYAESDTEPNYIPAGWMGNADAIKVTPDWAENPKSGKTSLKFDFTASEGWGGVVWQNPEGDWGDRGGGYNLSAAKTISFWARGDKGGEVIDFSYGILEAPKKFVDTANGSLKGVTLTTDWQNYKIPVEGKNLDRIKTGFVWTLASKGTPITFYLDDIQWE
jgi:hypothetical protein